MRFVKKLVTTAIVMTISSMAFAQPQSKLESAINLEGGQAGHNQWITISLDKLVPDIVYDVFCSLSSDHKSSDAFNDIKIKTANFSGTSFRVNGNILDMTGQINIPTSTESEIIAANVSQNGGALLIQNLDDKDIITAGSSHCYAEPHRS